MESGDLHLKPDAIVVLIQGSVFQLSGISYAKTLPPSGLESACVGLACKESWAEEEVDEEDEEVGWWFPELEEDSDADEDDSYVSSCVETMTCVTISSPGIVAVDPVSITFPLALVPRSARTDEYAYPQVSSIVLENDTLGRGELCVPSFTEWTDTFCVKNCAAITSIVPSSPLRSATLNITSGPVVRVRSFQGVWRGE